MAKWQAAVSRHMKKAGTKGALHETMGVPKDKKIPTEDLESSASELHKRSANGKLSAADRLKSERVNYALRARGS